MRIAIRAGSFRCGDVHHDAAISRGHPLSRARLHLFCGLRMTAAAKVNSFLLQLSDRLSHVGAGWFDIPTSLDEIADYLELSTQTVECCLTLLEEQRAIASSGAKRICILDRGALAVVGDVCSSAGRPILPFISQQAQRRRSGPPDLDCLVAN